MTACYAWLEALGTAQAARLLHLHRSRPRPDFDRFTQTPDPTPDKETSIGTISDRRPALIISNNALNRAFGVAIALPMSRTMPAEENRRQHVHVAASDSWASAWQIKSIDQARLSDPIGRASPASGLPTLRPTTLWRRTQSNPTHRQWSISPRRHGALG